MGLSPPKQLFRPARSQSGETKLLALTHVHHGDRRVIFQNVNTHTREQAARQRTDTSVEADEERHRCR